MDAELCRQNLFDEVHQEIKRFFVLESKLLENCRSRGRLATPLETHEIICILQILSFPDRNLQPRFIYEFFVLYHHS